MGTVRLKYRNLPVRHKLRLIIMVTVCTALMLAGGAVLIGARFALHQSMQNDLNVLAEIYSLNSTAALTFDDRKAAQELLSGLKAKRSIEFAIIYSADGRMFASYRREDEMGAPEAPRLETDVSWFEGDR